MCGVCIPQIWNIEQLLQSTNCRVSQLDGSVLFMVVFFSALMSPLPLGDSIGQVTGPIYGDIGGVLLIRIEWRGAIRDVEERCFCTYSGALLLVIGRSGVLFIEYKSGLDWDTNLDFIQTGPL